MIPRINCWIIGIRMWEVISSKFQLIDPWEILLKCYILYINNFMLIFMTDGWGISGGIALRWLSLDHTDDISTMVQAMACSLQETSQCLSQCWLESMSPYDALSHNELTGFIKKTFSRYIPNYHKLFNVPFCWLIEIGCIVLIVTSQKHYKSAMAS